jgi:VanZ family protein
MAAIMWFSSDSFSAENTGSIVRTVLQWLLPWASPSQIATLHAVVRKTAHVTEYAALAVLWFVAFVHARRWSAARAAWGALLIAIVWAFLDELHQSTQPSRTGSVLDLGYDAGGALLGCVIARVGWRCATDRATTVLLWLAFGGGAVAIAVNLANGIGSGVLWVTAPVAAALLLLRRRRSGSWKV